MRVEACGNIEPKTGDTLLHHHRSQRLSEPISIINPKNTSNNYLSNHERRYSDLNLFEGEPTISGRNTLNLTIGPEHPNSTLPIGFFLSEEEWSFFKQPHIGLEPYERKKMTSLPKSFTPLASAFGGLGLEGRSSSVTESASDSTVSRQRESLNVTPSLVKLSDEKEQNNNEVPQESGQNRLSKVIGNASATSAQNVQDVRDTHDEGSKNLEYAFSHEEFDSSPYCNTVTTSSSTLNAQATERTMSEGYLHSSHLEPNVQQLLDNGICGDFQNCQYPHFLHHSRHNGSTVDTIDSHPMPISSSCRNQVHTPSHLQSHHHCYNISSLNTQQAAIGGDPSSPFFPNFNQQPNQQHQNFNYLWQDSSGGYGAVCDPNGHHTQGNKWSYEKYSSAAENEGLVVQNLVAPASQEPTTVRLPGGRPDEMDTLLTFLSKFDDKVAAIWGQQGAAAAMFAASLSKAGSNPNSESSTIESNSSTPTGCASDLSYAWGSPTLSSKGTMNGFPTHCMGMPVIQSEEQQRALAESQRVAESFYQKQYLSLQRKDYPQGINLNPPQHKPHPQKSNNRISIGSPIISPPSGKHTIMHSLKEYFGSPPGHEDYHIFRELDASSSNEETERSLEILNHSEEASVFVRFIPTAAARDDLLGMDDDGREDFFDFQIGFNENEDASTEVEIKAMQDVLNSLELDGDEELEIVEACKVSQPDDNPDELVQSWKTHFIPVATIEENARKHASSVSPYATLAPHQINPNLPEYKLFGNEIPDGYKTFRFPGKTLFPIKYKLRTENHKSVQTETLGELTQSNVQQHDSYYQPYTVFNWEGFNPGNQHPYVLANRRMSPLSTLVRYDNENHLEGQGSGWNTSVGTGQGNGNLLDVDYNLNRGMDMDGLGVNYRGRGGGHPQYLHAEYCCDSGIDIDVGSRIGFYEDGVTAEYDVDPAEYLGAGCGPMSDDTGGMTLLQNPHMGLSGSENDVDYGQFQGSYSMYPVELSSSATSSKHGKSSRRRAKVKPCKYFFLDGSCRRGKECKFSHDLTTCRYWAEGSCLKGESCPYLHCFLDRKELSEDQVSITSSKRYLLESENDFPALGGLGNSKSNLMGSSRVPMSMGFLPSPALPDEIGDGGHLGGNYAMLADPAGCAPSIGSIGLSNYGFDEMGLETFVGSGFDGGIFNDGFSSAVNKFTFGSSKINNNDGPEQRGQGRSKGNVVPGGAKQRKNKRLVDETATPGGSLVGPWSRQMYHNKGVSSGGVSSNGWNCSFVVNTKEKRKKKKH